MEYSPYQKDIFKWVRSGSGNAQIVACAGGAKTFSAVKSASYIPKGMISPDVMYLAFNKHIQIELSQKLPDWVQSSTYHSFGLKSITNALGKLKIDGYKNQDILKARFGQEHRDLFGIINRAVGLFKGNLETYSEETLLEYLNFYGIDMGEEGWDNFSLITSGVELLLDPEHTERLGKVDFDDMIWYPVIKKLPMPKYDWIFVDEAQDTNLAQTEVIIRSVNGRGRVVVIGDSSQAIYGWRGAGIDSMDILQTRLNAKTLPLSVTYRCPKAVVELINQEFPEIPFELWDQADDGVVQELPAYKAHQEYKPGDMVLCRLNAPLVAPAMALLKERRKATIRGRDIGKNLLSIIYKVERQFFSRTMDDFIDDLSAHVMIETERLLKRDQRNSIHILEDKRDTIMAFAEGCESVPEMKRVIEQIFSDTNEGVVFSTVHKAKGLEADNVFILNPELMPFKRATNEWQMQQERNIQYVAWSRPRKSLNFVQESIL